MNSIIQSFQYLKGYWGRVGLNILFTIITTFLDLFSLLSVLPFLELIFSTKEVKPVSKPAKINWSNFQQLKGQLSEHLSYFKYDLLQQYDRIELLTFICIAVFISIMLKNLFTYANRLTDRSIRYNVAKDIRQKIYDKVLKLPIHYFNEQRRGDILTRFSSDVLKLEENVLSGYSLLFKEPVNILVFLVMLFFISTKLTLFILILFPVLGFIIGRISKSLKRKSGAYQNKLGELLSFLDETMFGAKVIKSFTAEKHLANRFEQENTELKRLSKKISQRSMASSPISEALGVGLVMIVLWFGGRLVLSGNEIFTGSMLVAYILVFSRLISPVKALSDLYSRLQDGLASADRIEDFISLPEEYPELLENESSPDFSNQIRFENVNFWYPNTDKKVLDNLSLTLPKGTVTALVGQSGAGKSTIADLLPRFYTVEDGSITIDGKNVNDFPLHKLRSLFSYVSQEAILFNDSIWNNIAFGLKNVSQKQIEEAAKIANAHDFITKLENGYQTNIGERGGKLSGGQKQRITIARAILKNAPILILDEATSALDTESERLVQDAIERLLENRTALVIAHRLSTIKNADQICVVDNGKIVEKGNHQELIEKEGLYKNLTEMQAL